VVWAGLIWLRTGTSAIARQQLRKYATVLEPLLASGPRATMEVLFEAVFSMCPLRGYIVRPTEFSSVSAVQWSGASWLVRGLLR
jgi:hypothetical protein